MSAYGKLNLVVELYDRVGYMALAIIAGAFWCVANWYAWSYLLRVWLLKEANYPLKAALGCVFKFPIQYVVGYAFLHEAALSPGGLLTGFSLALAAMSLVELSKHLAHKSSDRRF
jgi:hypothetical protein